MERQTKMDDLEWRPLEPRYDAAVAELVRSNLRAYGLDIPGTAYYDEWLDHLSDFYREPGRGYEVLLSDGQVIGGVGLAAFEGDCCELQKLYLADAAKGRGLGCIVGEGFIVNWAIGHLVSLCEPGEVEARWG